MHWEIITMATSMYWEIFPTIHKSSHPPARKTSAFVLFGPKSDQLGGTRGLQLLYLVHLETPAETTSGLWVSLQQLQYQDDAKCRSRMTKVSTSP